MLLKRIQDQIPVARERIAEIAQETPTEESLRISEIAGCQVYLKLEHLQQTGSFKLRGASNKILSLSIDERQKGVVAASTGNHGLGVCYAAAQTGVKAKIFLPNGVSPSKVSMIRALGGEVIFYGDDCLEAELQARADAEASGRTFISPYNDPEVIAGQGTVGLELTSQVQDLDAVFVSVGGGGLIGGIGAYIKAVCPTTRVIGCWPENSKVVLECMRAGQIIEVAEKPTVSESTAGGLEPGSITFDLCCQVIDDAALVTEEEIVDAMRLLVMEERWMVEGAAGLALAAMLKAAPDYQGKRLGVVLCGRNISWEKFRSLVN